jgi:hypothetical protein
MATYIDALNGDHTDGREQFTMDNTMADIQADDMKHGLYDDRDQRAESIDDLPYLIATKLLEVVSQDDLEDSYYEMQLEWAQTLPDEELMQTARDLGIL